MDVILENLYTEPIYKMVDNAFSINYNVYSFGCREKFSAIRSNSIQGNLECVPIIIIKGSKISARGRTLETST